MELKNKVVIVTGSSSGIGKTIAIRFAKEGAKVVVNYHINEKGAEKTKEEIERVGGKCVVVKADVTSKEDIKRLFVETTKTYGTLDILINNAASPTEFVPYFDATAEDIDKLFRVNIISAMICSKYAIEIMKKKGSGKIINTSSIKGWEHGGSSVGYAVSKAAINSFTKTLAKSVAPNIQVNAVAPGYVKTRVYNNQPEEKIKNWLEGTYLKRWITEDEIADAFIFLSRNDAMTGQVIYVDGGFTLK